MYSTGYSETINWSVNSGGNICAMNLSNRKMSQVLLSDRVASCFLGKLTANYSRLTGKELIARAKLSKYDMVFIDIAQSDYIRAARKKKNFSSKVIEFFKSIF